MSQLSEPNKTLTDVEEQFAVIERRQKAQDWFFRIMIPAIVILLFAGIFVILS